jgi:hypothetical protein
MINILVWLFGIVVVFFTLTMIGENIAANLPPENRFRQWWRRNIIGDDIYGDDF